MNPNINQLTQTITIHHEDIIQLGKIMMEQKEIIQQQSLTLEKQKTIMNQLVSDLDGQKNIIQELRTDLAKLTNPIIEPIIEQINPFKANEELSSKLYDEFWINIAGFQNSVERVGAILESSKTTRDKNPLFEGSSSSLSYRDNMALPGQQVLLSHTKFPLRSEFIHLTTREFFNYVKPLLAQYLYVLERLDIKQSYLDKSLQNYIYLTGVIKEQIPLLTDTIDKIKSIIKLI